ncbi:hypothetical protein CLAIMM_12869 [Cladophialophora immunda]|nr:hypothetical protein CLAIMM_12869 [Cladophialophora immunda]
MAEAVGLAASVLGLAQVGWTVAKGLHDLGEEVGSAGEAVRIFANDFHLFVETVQTLGDLFESSPPVSRRAQSTTEELLDVAMEQVVAPFEKMLVELEPLLVKWRDSPSRMMQLGVRLQWAFAYKKRVLFYHSALNALKGNVSLLLQAMTLRGHNPPHVQFILCQSIEDAKTLLRGGSRVGSSRLQISMYEGTVNARAIVPAPETASKSRSMIGAIPGEDRHQLSTETALVRVTDADDLNDSDEVNKCLTGIKLLELDEVINSEPDREVNEEQLEAFGAIRAVQKKVIKLADETTTTATLAPDQTDKAAGSNTSPSRTSAGSGAIFQGPEGKVLNEIPVIVAPQGHADESRSRQTTQPEAAENAESTQKKTETIRIIDSLGSYFDIPYGLVTTWQASAAVLLARLYGY